jgi:HAD superfamily hydrolase (TIGR01548 family)
MPPEVLVFDMDGVLVDVTESYREAIRQTVRCFTGREIGNDAIQDLKNAGGWNNDWALAHHVISGYGFAVDYETVVARFQEIFFGDGRSGLAFRERWVPQAGLLERLGRRFRLAIFTGRTREEARMTLDRFAPDVNFDPVIADEDVVNGKPAPDGLGKIAALTGLARIWYVGDTVDDARSAKAAGARFIGIASESNPRRAELQALFAAENAFAVLSDINQLEVVL